MSFDYAAGRTVNLLSAAHHLAWTQHPTIWLCESCAILWLVLRVVRSPWVRVGVLQMLGGLMLNALVTVANAGTMPVVGMPPTLHPASPVWQAATSETRLAFLADQAWLGLFSIGDLVLLSGGILIVAICLRRTLNLNSSLKLQAAGMDSPRNDRFAQRSWNSNRLVKIPQSGQTPRRIRERHQNYSVPLIKRL
jgi:hypothetical protein